MTRLFKDFAASPERLARGLLGQRLVRVRRGERLSGRIVEVEAYLGVRDKAAHSFGGRRTARNASMFLAGGHAYVYQIYGLHYCLNLVCGPPDDPTAVLIRALEPLEGIATMQSLRPNARQPHLLCAGPGNLARALDVDRALDGTRLGRAAALYVEREARPGGLRPRVVATPRIGVAYAEEWAERPLRFYLEGSPSVSGRRNGRPARAATRARL
jgi:DNA-3-methyladenine glycosylase